MAWRRVTSAAVRLATPAALNTRVPLAHMCVVQELLSGDSHEASTFEIRFATLQHGFVSLLRTRVFGMFDLCSFGGRG